MKGMSSEGFRPLKRCSQTPISPKEDSVFFRPDSNNRSEATELPMQGQPCLCCTHDSGCVLLSSTCTHHFCKPMGVVGFGYSQISSVRRGSWSNPRCSGDGQAFLFQ